MKKTIITSLCVLGVGVILVAGWFVLFWQPGPAYDEVAYLETPEIIQLPEESLLTLTMTGAPDETAPKAIGALYNAYMKAGGSWSDPVSPRARWNWDPLRKQLTGIYAMPLPAGATTLPSDIDSRIKLETWQYGEVAQILHVGSYDNEASTIEKLEQFIDDEGYRAVGKHEEVYLKSMNMFGNGNEKKFLTIIRYRVKVKK